MSTVQKYLEYKFVIWMLVSTEFKQRYTQSFLGMLWTVLEPLILVGTLSLVFTLIGRKGPMGTSFPAFFYTGVFIWNLYAFALSQGPRALIQDKSILSKSNYPRRISIIRSTSIAFAEFCFSLAPLAVILVYYRHWPHLSWFALPVLVLMVLMLNFVVTQLVAPLNVHIRDIGILMKSLKTVWFWFTPVIFHFEAGTRAEILFYVNPMAGLVANIRNILIFSEPINYEYLICPAVWIVVLGVLGSKIFDRLEPTLLDVM